MNFYRFIFNKLYFVQINWKFNRSDAKLNIYEVHYTRLIH